MAIEKEFRHLVEFKSEIIISGSCPELNIGSKYVILCSKVIQGKYEGSYKIEQMVFANFLVKEDKNKTILESFNYAESTIQCILEAYPNICDLIMAGKKDEIDMSKIKGFTEKNLNNLINKIENTGRELYLILNFQEYQLTFNMAKLIFKKYNNQIEKFKIALEKDPYKTLCDIEGMGFKKADKLILKAKPQLINSKYRLISATEHIIKENEMSGSTYIPIIDCYNLVKELVPECINKFTEIVKANDRLYVDNVKKVISLRSTYEIEKYLSQRLLEGLGKKKYYNFDYKKWEKTKDGDELTEQQKSILPLLEKHSISILCGFAGVGKSTSVNAVIEMLKDNGKSFLAIAPTGRASKVLHENIGEDTGTIHRMVLNQKIIDTDFLICDEATMIDIFLMKELFERINFNRTSILFICDPAQLSSVGCGNVLADMISSQKFPLVFLDKVFRYNEGGISYVATEIRNGQSYIQDGTRTNNIIKFGANQDYVFVETNDDDINQQIIKMYQNLMRKGKLDINEIVILSAYNKGKYGTIVLNNHLQKLINPKTPNNETTFSKKVDNTEINFRIGDRVIQIKNDYNVPLKENDKETTNVFNGEDGTITDATKDFLIIKFNGVETKYDKSMLSNLMLGYAMTIHKSQGSTFKNVIVVSPNSHKFFFTRNLLYVATTRASSRVIHIGSLNLVYSALKKNESKKRNTFLKDLLIGR
ncbi:MAG: AAA family ATPase [Lachnospirales bacterium]